MFDEMNSNETIVEQVEEKMLYKILLIAMESKDLDELKEKIKAMLNK